MTKSKYIQPFQESLVRVQNYPTMMEPIQVATQVLDTVDLGTIPPRPMTIASASSGSTLKEQIKSALDTVVEYLKKPVTWVVLVVVAIGVYFATKGKSKSRNKRR